MDNSGAELGLTVKDVSSVGNPKEESMDEIQQQIIAEVMERLKSPQAQTLEYPNANAFSVAKGYEQPDYENGSKLRFLMLDSSHGFTRDELCIAVLDNRSVDNSRSFGAGLPMVLQGLHSNQEISVTRFVQSAPDKLKKTGTYYRLNLSDLRTREFLATHSVKGRAYPNPPPTPQGSVPRFVDRWNDGSVELAPVILFDVLGTPEDVVSQDYSDILRALKKGKPSKNLTGKVIESEKEYQLAQLAPVHEEPQRK